MVSTMSSKIFKYIFQSKFLNNICFSTLFCVAETLYFILKFQESTVQIQESYSFPVCHNGDNQPLVR